jgi:3-deoxy-manno-octulosonate cytidylyltransferase (CMP-KDO synthetase)
MKVVGIIPARFASTRFPGKPLALIQGKTMIQRVYEQASQSAVLCDLYVATDDERIENHVKEFGGKAMMTSALHLTGTERCNEVLSILAAKGEVFDVAINIQGDEPFINPEQIDLVAACFSNRDVQIATLVKKISNAADLLNTSVMKVVVGLDNKALYFSRQPIPFIRGRQNGDWLVHHTFYKHIGIYAYRAEILTSIAKLRPTPLEIAESLEQLRWLENGYNIYVAYTEHESHSIDTPEDIDNATNDL